MHRSRLSTFHPCGEKSISELGSVCCCQNNRLQMRQRATGFTLTRLREEQRRGQSAALQHPLGGSREVKNTSRWRQQGSRVSPQTGSALQESSRCFVPGGSAFERWEEAAPAVDSFGAGRLSSLLTELVAAQSPAEPSVRCLVLLIKRSCRRRENWIIIKYL